MSTFQATIREARRRLQLTQVQLAALLDVDKQSISNWECGRSTPWPAVEKRALERLAALLDPAELGAGRPMRRRVIDRMTWED